MEDIKKINPETIVNVINEAIVNINDQLYQLRQFAMLYSSAVAKLTPKQDEIKNE